MPKVNFRKIIRELKRNDYSDALLAHECACSSTYIKQIGLGKSRPGYDIGARLIELHEAIQ